MAGLSPEVLAFIEERTQPGSDFLLEVCYLEMLRHWIYESTPASGTSHTILTEMLFCRQADNFLAYLRDLLAAIYAVKRRAMPDGESVISEGAIPDVAAQDLADKDARRREKLAKALNELLKLNLFGKDRAENIFLDLRDSIVHHRGIINSEIKGRLEDKGFKVLARGDLVDISPNLYDAATSVFSLVMLAADQQAAKNFELPIGQAANPALWARLEASIAQIRPELAAKLVQTSERDIGGEY